MEAVAAVAVLLAIFMAGRDEATTVSTEETKAVMEFCSGFNKREYQYQMRLCGKSAPCRSHVRQKAQACNLKVT